MLRYRTEEGWFLLTHPEHARIAGEFAKAWGNGLFRAPFPREDVLAGIRRHDDGWSARDVKPLLTREGKPSAFGVDLVGKYSAFEEIDLADYLGVRGRAMEVVAADNPYAAILISMHTCNLLTVHADRSTIRPSDLPLLDAFLERQEERQGELRLHCAVSGRYRDQDLTAQTLLENFRLLQACDNMSLMSCVDYGGPATLLHPLPLTEGGTSEVTVTRIGVRRFRLAPWPFSVERLEVPVSGRRVVGERFGNVAEIESQFLSAPIETLSITLEA
jgi:hypothetical protein